MNLFCPQLTRQKSRRVGGQGVGKGVEWQCTSGLQVTPEKGMGVIFYSMLPWGEMDEMSLHVGELCGVRGWGFCLCVLFQSC